MASGIGAGVTVLNVDQLVRKLNAMPEKLAKKLERSSLRVAGKILLAKTKELAPVFKGIYPPKNKYKPGQSGGALKKAIKLRAPRRSRKNKNKIRLRVVFGQQDSTNFQGDYFYGAIYEFGSVHQPPRPFMKEAANASRDAVKSAFRSDLTGKIAALANQP